MAWTKDDGLDVWRPTAGDGRFVLERTNAAANWHLSHNNVHMATFGPCRPDRAKARAAGLLRQYKASILDAIAAADAPEGDGL